MKTHARVRSFLTVAGIAAVMIASAIGGHAEDKPEKPWAPPPPPGYPDEGRQQRDAIKTRVDGLNETHGRVKGKPEANAAMKYDIVIANRLLMHDGKADAATLGLVVEELRKIQPQANIVLATGLVDVPVGDLKLHARNVIEVLQALRVATDDKFDWWGPGSLEANRPGSNQAGAINVQTGLPLEPAATDPNSGLFTLREPAKAGAGETVVEAFNIGPYLDIKRSEARVNTQSDTGKPGGTISTKIDAETVAQLEMMLNDTIAVFRKVQNGELAHLKFEYHQGATLLIVIGPRPDVEVVRKIMNALTTDPTGVRVTGGSQVSYVRDELVSVESIPLKAVPMDMAYTAANSLLTDKRSKVVVADERSKTLIVSGTKAEVAAIRKAIEQLGASKPYVGDFPTTEGKPAGKPSN